MGIYKTSLPHRPDGVIGFTSSCPVPILQQNCAHAFDLSELCRPGLKLRLKAECFELFAENIKSTFRNSWIYLTVFHQSLFMKFGSRDVHFAASPGIET